MTKGAGLQNVYSRMDYLKGHLIIESETVKGSSVNVDITLWLFLINSYKWLLSSGNDEFNFSGKPSGFFASGKNRLENATATVRCYMINCLD